MLTYGRADYLELGDWNIMCSMCGRKRKVSTVVRNWQGLYRCPEHDEPRHPQDFARGLPDKMGVPFAQPPTKRFVVFEVNPNLPPGSMPADPREGAAGGFNPPDIVARPQRSDQDESGLGEQSGQDFRSADDTG